MKDTLVFDALIMHYPKEGFIHELIHNTQGPPLPIVTTSIMVSSPNTKYIIYIPGVRLNTLRIAAAAILRML